MIITPIARSDRKIFDILYRYARNLRQQNPGCSAYMIVDLAERAYFDNLGYDDGIDRVCSIGRAVLWAMHWRFFGPARDKRWWQSERHRALLLAAEGSGERSRTWFERPGLPG